VRRLGGLLTLVLLLVAGAWWSRSPTEPSLAHPQADLAKEPTTPASPTVAPPEAFAEPLERAAADDPRLLATQALTPRWKRLAELLPQSKQPQLAEIAVGIFTRVEAADLLDEAGLDALVAEQRQLSGYLRSRYTGFAPITDELDAIDAGLAALPATAAPLRP